MPRRPRNLDLNKELGIRIRAAREKAEMSQSRLAELIRSTAPTISRIEAGAMAPTLATLNVVANALNVTLSSLFDESNAPFVTPPSIESLSHIEQELVHGFRKLTPEVQRAVHALVDSVNG